MSENKQNDLERALDEISKLPTHACDDARNLASLERAKQIANAALAKATP